MSTDHRLIRFGDWIILLLSALVIGWLYGWLWSGGGWAERLTVEGPNHFRGSYSLAHHQLLRVEGRLGTSVIEIQPGRARFRTSPCRNKICLHQGWVKQAGEVAACLPNGISVSVAGRRAGYDAESY